MTSSDTLRAAARAGDLEVMSRLLRADPALSSQENPDALPIERLALTVRFHLSLLEGAHQETERLLTQHPDLVSQCWTTKRFTPLSQAVVECDERAFELLLRSGADPHVTYDGGSSLLHTVAFSGCVSLAARLVALGLDVNSKSEAGLTPQQIARDLGHEEMVRFLREQAARS